MFSDESRFLPKFVGVSFNSDPKSQNTVGNKGLAEDTVTQLQFCP